jgi:predicted nucleotidyltransferase
MIETPFADVNALVDLLHTRILAILGERLVGLYLTGSLVTGDFIHDVSDIDLVAATSTELDMREFARLADMHEEVARANAAWRDRIDISYMPLAVLRVPRLGERYSVLYPHEPFHLEEAASDLLISRYILREKAIAVDGPSPHTLLDPVPTADLIRAVEHACIEWRRYINHTHSRNSQVLAILTMSRALYTVRHCDFVSKKAAALWAEKTLPEWSSVIRWALASWQNVALWHSGNADSDTTLPDSKRFVNFVIDRIVGEDRGSGERELLAGPAPSDEQPPRSAGV